MGKSQLLIYDETNNEKEVFWLKNINTRIFFNADLVITNNEMNIIIFGGLHRSIDNKNIQLNDFILINLNLEANTNELNNNELQENEQEIMETNEIKDVNVNNSEKNFCCFIL